MCTAKNHGGRRCGSDYGRRAYSAAGQAEKWNQTIEELTAKLNRTTSPKHKEALEAKIQKYETAVHVANQRVEELLDDRDRTGFGMTKLATELSDPDISEAQKTTLLFHLAKAKVDAAAEKRNITENRTRIANTLRAMEQAGFSEEDRNSITERFLTRGMNRLPYSSAEAEAEKRAVVMERRELLTKIKGLKDAVDEDPDLDADDRREAKQEIDAEYAGEMAVMKQRLRLAKRKYDATPAGLEELRSGYERKKAEGDTYLATQLKARLLLAEREVRLRADERNARSAMRRAVIKAAKKAGADPEQVWTACKSITPVNADGTPVRVKGRISKSPLIRLSARETDALRDEAVAKYKDLPADKAVRELVRSRILTNTRQLGIPQETSAPLTKHGGIRRNSTNGSRDARVYPYFTHKEFEQVTATAKSLGIAPSSYMRLMATNRTALVGAYAGRKAQQNQWHKKVMAL